MRQMLIDAYQAPIEKCRLGAGGINKQRNKSKEEPWAEGLSAMADVWLLVWGRRGRHGHEEAVGGSIDPP